MRFCGFEIHKKIKKKKKIIILLLPLAVLLQITCRKRVLHSAPDRDSHVKKTHTSVNNHIYFFKPALCRKTNIQLHDLGLIH